MHPILLFLKYPLFLSHSPCPWSYPVIKKGSPGCSGLLGQILNWDIYTQNQVYSEFQVFNQVLIKS